MNEKQEKLKLEAVSAEETNVDKYKFDPIQGYPMLNWKGKRPFRSTHYYPAQLKEVYGDEVDGWRNKIYWGDNLQVMSHLLKEFRGEVNLAYIDPPFNSKTSYASTIKLKGREVSNDQNAFEEKQYSDIWTNDEYLQFMYERLTLIKELLADNGSIFLHCDRHKSHHLRCLMEEIFGANAFQNEIIWFYRRWPSRASCFQSMHDNIFWYTKSTNNSHTFNSLFESASERTLSDYGGKKLTTVATDDGSFVKRETEEESLGVPMRDVWEIKRVHPRGGEHTKYPTQKPIELLSRIVEAASNPGDLVFDCFAGSGTTLLAALKSGRRFIGADINLGGIQVSIDRLNEAAKELKKESMSLVKSQSSGVEYAGFEVHNVNNYDVFRNPQEAKELLIEALEIQKLQANNLYDGEKDGRFVKIMPVNRVATKADLGELIAGFDYKAFDRRQTENPSKPIEKILLVCMGHEADLAASLQTEVNYRLDIEVVDILRDKSNLEFKRDAEAKIDVIDGELVVEQFYPMNLLQKLSLQKENVEDWRELVESVMVDWNFDGAVLSPAEIDVPEKNDLVSGRYKIPEDAGTIRVKITDLLSESLEMEVPNA